MAPVSTVRHSVSQPAAEEQEPQVAQVDLVVQVVEVLDEVLHVPAAQVLQGREIPAVLGNIYKMEVAVVAQRQPAVAAAVVPVVQVQPGSMEQLMPAAAVVVVAKSVAAAMPVVQAAEDRVLIQHNAVAVKL